MRRSLVAILVMGILSVAALGLGASYLLDQSPEIQSVAHFKAEAVADLAVSSITMRIVARDGGKVALITAEPSPAPKEKEAAERLAFDLALRLIAAAGEHLAADVVQVDLTDEARWGCREAPLLHSFAWRAGSLRAQTQFRRGADDLSAALARDHPALGASVEAKEEEAGRRCVTIRLSNPGDFEEARLQAILALARSSFSRAPYREIRFTDATGTVRARYPFYGKRLDAEAK